MREEKPLMTPQEARAILSMSQSELQERIRQIMSEKPRRDDAKAANAARPRDYEYSDSERDHDYLMAVDVNYRIDWYLEHGYPEEARREAEDERQRRWESGDEWDEDEEE